MKGRVIFKWTLGILTIALFLKLILLIVVQPWVSSKVETSLNKNFSGFIFEINRVHLLLFSRAIKLESIIVFSESEIGDSPDSVGVVSSVHLKGINLVSALFKKDISIRNITISDSELTANFSFPEKGNPPIVSKLNIQIGKLIFENVNLVVTDTVTSTVFSVKNGYLELLELKLSEQDTLALCVAEQFVFNAKELSWITSDSLYTYTIQGVSYSAFTNVLEVNSLALRPNFSDYEFTRRSDYETDRFDVLLRFICVNDFSVIRYLQYGDIASSNIEIGCLDMKAFRDKREKFRHVCRPTFQELIYNYPAAISIDSVAVLDGNITYIEHAEEASEAGFISFNHVKAAILNISNDSVYKSETAFFELNTKAVLMGKGKLSVQLKSKLFDPQNTFTLEGTLTGMEMNALNPMLEKNAFVFVKSGIIDALDFNFTANNTKASGKLIMRYHDLDFDVVNKTPGDSTVVIDRFKSFVAGLIVMDANPVSGSDVRQGIIDYERDPEKFLFNYCFKSIFSGMKYTLVKKEK